MRLLAVIVITYLIVGLGVFCVAGYFTFWSVKGEIDMEQRYFLIERFQRLENFIQRRPPSDSVIRDKIMIIPLKDSVASVAPFFTDTVVMHSTLQRMETHLKLNAITHIEGKSYRVEIFDVIVESDDIMDGVVKSMSKSYLILLVSFSIIGALLSYWILAPLRQAMLYIQDFSLVSPNKQKLPIAGVKEFKNLNKFLNDMTDKSVQDYMSLKEFTENASHELMTPLAIAQSKLETLLNDDNLSEYQTELLSSAQHAMVRLGKLSHSLALLTKIENREFSNSSLIDLSAIIKRMCDSFSELMELKSIQFEIKEIEPFEINADIGLIEILLSNLFNNAIRHNNTSGIISITLTKGVFVISNTGQPLEIDPELLFQRFRKSNQSTSSLGLGLSIVKKIADYYQYSIRYAYENGWHKIEIGFKVN